MQLKQQVENMNTWLKLKELAYPFIFEGVRVLDIFPIVRGLFQRWREVYKMFAEQRLHPNIFRGQPVAQPGKECWRFG